MLLVKWPGQDGAMGTHQDWTFVDERRFRSVTVWCPLVDVEQRNGALELLPGSHRILTHARCSPSLPETYQDPLAGLGDGDQRRKICGGLGSDTAGPEVHDAVP